jgi:hypothetical protein
MSSRLLLWLALAIGSLAVSESAAADLTLGPQPGVLMLRNGQLVEGEILLAGDRYDVSVGGGQIHIKRGDVDFVGKTVLDCYQHRRSRIEVGKVQEDLELAEWCLRLQLYEQAALALADAVDADALHPRIALLERRLKFALERPADAVAAVAQPFDGPSTRDLDRMVEGLPAGCVETFTTLIQPVLLNHCSTAGCHGPQSETPLKLLRIPAGHTPSRRATQRNLYSVLGLVNREHPDESSLLVVPTKPHGNVRSAIFTSRETNQYRQLVTWTYQLSNQMVPVDVALAIRPNSPAAQRASRRQQVRHKEPRRAGESTAEGKQPSQPVARHLPGQPAVRPSDESAAGETDSADPFDPEIFNRRSQKSTEPD